VEYDRCEGVQVFWFGERHASTISVADIYGKGRGTTRPIFERTLWSS